MRALNRPWVPVYVLQVTYYIPKILGCKNEKAAYLYILHISLLTTVGSYSSDPVLRGIHWLYTRYKYVLYGHMIVLTVGRPANHRRTPLTFIQGREESAIDSGPRHDRPLRGTRPLKSPHSEDHNIYTTRTGCSLDPSTHMYRFYLVWHECQLNVDGSTPAVLNLLLQFSHFDHHQTIISPLPQPNIP